MLILNMRKEKYSLNVFKGGEALALAVMLLEVESLTSDGGGNHRRERKALLFSVGSKGSLTL
jgi:hypothetical protein